VHSSVDAGNEALLLLGIQRAERTGVAHHHARGREVQFWSLVAAVLVLGIGAGVSIGKGFERLGELQPLRHASWIYLVIAMALLFQIGAGLLAWRAIGEARAGRPLLAVLRQAKDPAFFPLIFADIAAIAGLVAALIGVFGADRLGWLWADGAAALLIGAIMALAAVLLLGETRGLLIGAGAEPHLVEDIIGVAGRAAFVHGVNEVRTMQFGPGDVLVNLSVDARDYVSAGEVEAGVTALEAEIRSRHPEISRVFVEIQAAAAGPAADPPDFSG
jgi:divalent metal cation (Fe/Co/Zn/Cd) transporter